MRLLEANYGEVRIFSDRIFGYKRYHVLWNDGSQSTYSALWYSLEKVKQIVEDNLID